MFPAFTDVRGLVPVNRPGSPGDSVSWEMMESWEERSSIGRRCGSVPFGWCWSIGGSTARTGAGVLFGGGEVRLFV